LAAPSHLNLVRGDGVPDCGSGAVGGLTGCPRCLSRDSEPVSGVPQPFSGTLPSLHVGHPVHKLFRDADRLPPALVKEMPDCPATGAGEEAELPVGDSPSKPPQHHPRVGASNPLFLSHVTRYPQRGGTRNFIDTHGTPLL